jgi:hypothetical protein
MKATEAKRLKELEQENSRLKRLLADAELDKAMLKELAEGNFLACHHRPLSREWPGFSRVSLDVEQLASVTPTHNPRSLRQSAELILPAPSMLMA